MSDKLPRMDYRQHRRARRLVNECCNYDAGNCLLLDDGEPCVCVQSIGLGIGKHLCLKLLFLPDSSVQGFQLGGAVL